MSKTKARTDDTKNNSQRSTGPSKLIPRAQKKPEDNAATLPLTWEATEDIPRRRWWWFAVIGYVGISGAISAAALHTWSVAAVFVAAAIVLIVTHARKARALKFVLSDESLAIGDEVYFLNKYRSFTVEDTRTGTAAEPRFLIVLLPKKRLGLALGLTLTDDDKKNLVIAEAFGSLLPYEEAASYQASQRILNRMAMWLKLN